jgi:putative spermidine/putrescine transport system ATP-binding protein
MTVAGTPTAGDSMIRLIGVSKRYDAMTALHPVELDVARGEFLTLLGPSGSGKTTLLNLIAGIIAPSEGQIWIDGRDVTASAPNKRNLGMVFQNYALLPHRTIFENVAYPLRVRKVAAAAIRQRVERVLDLMQLSHLARRFPRELSGGQQQRVSIARIVYDPALILMDEPLGALDKKLREQMQIEIKRLHRQLGTTILYVTHDQEEALSMSDRIVLLNDGRILQAASPSELYFRPGSMFAATFLGASNLLGVREVVAAGAQAEAVLTAGGRITIGDRLPVPKQGSVKAVVRPECITLLAEDGAHGLANELAGTLTLSAILGGVTHHHIGLADGGTVMVQELTRAGRQIPPAGTPIRLAWAAEDTYLLPHDADSSAQSH